MQQTATFDFSMTADSVKPPHSPLIMLQIAGKRLVNFEERTETESSCRVRTRVVSQIRQFEFELLDPKVLSESEIFRMN